MPSALQHLLHVSKYTTLDEVRENDPGLTIDVVTGSAKEGVVSIKLLIWQLFVSHLKLPCNVDCTVEQNAFKVRRLPVCNNRWSLKKFTC